MNEIEKKAMDLLAASHRQSTPYSRKAGALEKGFVHPDDEPAIRAIVAALSQQQAVSEESRKPDYYGDPERGFFVPAAFERRLGFSRSQYPLALYAARPDVQKPLDTAGN